MEVEVELTLQSNLPGEDQGSYPTCSQSPTTTNFPKKNELNIQTESYGKISIQVMETKVCFTIFNTKNSLNKTI